MRFPFKMDLNTTVRLISNRLNGAKRLDRENRIYFESSLLKDTLTFKDLLSEDRKWIEMPKGKIVTRKELLLKMHTISNNFIDYDNFWKNCQDFSTFPLTQIDPKILTYSELMRNIGGHKLHLDKL